MTDLRTLSEEVAALSPQTTSEDITRLFGESLDVALNVPQSEMREAEGCFNRVLGAMMIQNNEMRGNAATLARAYADRFSVAGQSNLMRYLRKVADNLEIK